MATGGVEVWKPIPGHEGYEASNLGRVRSVDRTLEDGRFKRGSIIRPQINYRQGRRYVALGRTAKRPVAVCVAMAFLGHEPNGLEAVVDHINNDCTDDRLDNLQIVTNRKNIAKGYSVANKVSGLPTGVSRTKRNKKPFMASLFVNGKAKFLGTYYTIEEASAAYQQAAAEATK